MDILFWIFGTLLFVYICSKIKEAFFTGTIVEEQVDYVAPQQAASVYAPPTPPQESLSSKEPQAVYRAPRPRQAPRVEQPAPQQVIHETRIIHEQDNSLLNTVVTAAIVGDMLDSRRDRVVRDEPYSNFNNRTGVFVPPPVTQIDDTVAVDPDMTVSDQDSAGNVESMEAQQEDEAVAIDDSATSDDDSDMSVDTSSSESSSYESPSSDSSSDSASYDSSSSSDSSSSDSSGGGGDW